MTEKRKKYLKEWRKKNRTKIRLYFRSYYSQNKMGWEKYRHYTDRHYNGGMRRKKPYSNFFRNASPISLLSIRRHGKSAFLVYEKYNKKCAQCGQDWDLTIHHKDRKGRNYTENGLIPNNDINNLILLCRRCHGRIHGKENKRGKSL